MPDNRHRFLKVTPKGERACLLNIDHVVQMVSAGPGAGAWITLSIYDEDHEPKKLQVEESLQDLFNRLGDFE